MNFKKRVNGSWTDTPNYIYNTSTDTITTLPADLYADGNNATVGLVGNMSQTGIPTPTTPIQPQECGERTGNLFYKKISGANIDAQGKIIPNSEFDMVVAKVTEGETYSVSGVSGVMGFFVSEPELGSRSYNNARDSIVSPVTIPQGVNYVAYRVSDRPNVAMLNTGSTALPYEPYGQYKIPILNNSQTTNVYLGEVPTTRNIKKLVFDGTEDFQRISISGNLAVFVYILSDPAYRANDANVLSTHYVGSTSPTAGNIYIASTTIRLGIVDEFSSISNFQSYLAAQYANGTPVTVWYALAEPTTAIVNEPIRKIGAYADTISNVAEIPTTAGEQTFDVDTSLKPSSVEITYKGWHKHTPKEYDNGSWS